MANFYKKVKKGVKDKNDDYATPNSAWDAVLKYISKDKVIYEPFYLNGGSGAYIKSLGYKVIHKECDFYTWYKTFEYDLILSNPAFSDVKNILPFLFDLDKPFCLLMPSSKLHTQYLAKYFKQTDRKLQILVPRKRIHFEKYVDKKKVENWKPQTCFDCYWYCYKMGLPEDIIFM
jgi:hypothetical protein